MPEVKPGLYGLTDSNTNRTGENLWGKNQFNSTFPLALCLKMRDDGVKPVYVHLQTDLKFVSTADDLTMEEVVGPADADMFYGFECPFNPYTQFVNETLKEIDLVIFQGASRRPVRPLEVKLTVIPDQITAKQPKSKWGPEMVIRPVSSAYAMLNIGKRLSEDDPLRMQVQQELEKGYREVRRWDSIGDIAGAATHLTRALSETVRLCCPLQNPYLVQPIWHTKNKTFELASKCFDVFIWSDLSIISIPLERLQADARSSKKPVSRHLREVARHVKALYELCTGSKIVYDDCYGGMSLDAQTDKSFSVSGRVTRQYITHARLTEPHYPVRILPSLILHGGQNELKPERRFDAAVVAAKHVFQEHDG